ncbi:MAG: nucleotidyl transferase AbiEii/AbiGii toxin family protein [Deltaproteobacteria bacterium]|nr:nucleotidyl transferase AbiEii/AbiGii toxin family protein [Deltaproteobacteria bacterium]
MIEPSPQRALAEIAAWLSARRVSFALVGGLAVSIRGEVRFTRDVDLALAVSEAELEALIRDLRAARYAIHSLVEHDVARRTATVRLVTRDAIHVDLLAASSGIEQEIVGRATPIDIPSVGLVPVATAEDLVATKVLAMTDRRRRDFDDAIGLILANPSLDLAAVRERLSLITARGFHREQDLEAKLAAVLSAVDAEKTS